MTTSCPRCRHCIAISTQSRCRPPPGKSFMMANAIRIGTTADRAAKRPIEATLRGRQAFRRRLSRRSGLESEFVYRGGRRYKCAPQPDKDHPPTCRRRHTRLRRRAGQVRFNPPSRRSILPINPWINSDEANDTDRMIRAQKCIWLENRPGLHHIWPGADDRLCPIIMAACTNPKAEPKSAVPVSKVLAAVAFPPPLPQTPPPPPPAFNLTHPNHH